MSFDCIFLSSFGHIFSSSTQWKKNLKKDTELLTAFDLTQNWLVNVFFFKCKANHTNLWWEIFFGSWFKFESLKNEENGTAMSNVLQ